MPRPKSPSSMDSQTFPAIEGALDSLIQELADNPESRGLSLPSSDPEILRRQIHRFIRRATSEGRFQYRRFQVSHSTKGDNKIWIFPLTQTKTSHGAINGQGQGSAQREIPEEVSAALDALFTPIIPDEEF